MSAGGIQATLKQAGFEMVDGQLTSFEKENV